MSDEVIELDSDGNFNIPSPSKKDLFIEKSTIIEPSEEEIEGS